MNTDDFTPRRAIVTGSASGIGAACAVALAEAGLDVGITWHTDEAGAQHTAEAVRARGGRAVVTRFDATDLETAGRVLDGLADELGGVDVFVNNAGGGAGGAVLDLELGGWRQDVGLNLDAAFVGLQAAARRMAAAGTGGRIIAITSLPETHPPVGGAASRSEARRAGKRRV